MHSFMLLDSPSSIDKRYSAEVEVPNYGPRSSLPQLLPRPPGTAVCRMRILKAHPMSCSASAPSYTHIRSKEATLKIPSLHGRRRLATYPPQIPAQCFIPVKQPASLCKACLHTLSPLSPFLACLTLCRCSLHWVFLFPFLRQISESA